MTPARAATYFVGAILLAAWLASAAGVARPQTLRTPRPSPESTELDSVVVNVQAQTSRLRQRLAGAPSPQAPMRNPFTFAARATAPALPPRAPKPASVVENPPLPELDFVLIGIAEQGTTRTAMIESGDELLMATEGQTLAGRYRVAKVSVDALELVDLESGATRRLFLRSPASLL
jgi:Tfp pilus assembly protein PilP